MPLLVCAASYGCWQRMCVCLRTSTHAFFYWHTHFYKHTLQRRLALGGQGHAASRRTARHVMAATGRSAAPGGSRASRTHRRCASAARLNPTPAFGPGIQRSMAPIPRGPAPLHASPPPIRPPTNPRMPARPAARPRFSGAICPPNRHRTPRIAAAAALLALLLTHAPTHPPLRRPWPPTRPGPPAARAWRR